MKLTGDSHLEVIRDLLICMLMLSAERKGQPGALIKMRGLELFPSGTGWRNGSHVENELSSRVKTAPFCQPRKPSPVYSGLLFPGHPSCSRRPHSICHSIMSLLCGSNLSAFFQPCIPQPKISQFYLFIKVPFRCHIFSEDFHGHPLV